MLYLVRLIGDSLGLAEILKLGYMNDARHGVITAPDTLYHSLLAQPSEVFMFSLKGVQYQARCWNF